jgi:hypothetical protein
MRFHLPRFTSAHAIALIALFVALGGTVYAASSINGKSIKKGSIPGNRLKTEGVTGTQIVESTLGTVPSAAQATKANEATKAAEAAKAVQATKAVEATKATTASTANSANNANHANVADSAGTAADSAALGGFSAGNYQRGCANGAIRGVARVNENNGNPQLITAFNCSGGPIHLARKGPGKYEVDFEGVGAVLSATASVIVPGTAATVEGQFEGSFLVTTFNTKTETLLDNDQFTIVVY